MLGKAAETPAAAGGSRIHFHRSARCTFAEVAHRVRFAAPDGEVGGGHDPPPELSAVLRL